MKANILYIDDEVKNLEAFFASYRRSYNIFITESTEEGRKILDEEDIQIVITDQRMPKMTGVEFLESILEVHPHPVRVLLTGYSDIDAVIGAINKGNIYRYIQKPWNDTDLKMNLDKCLEYYNLKKENRELTEKLLIANQQLEFIARQNLLS
jgi:response regulator RpfG family c-di-GMP phosphodiesterase